MNGRWLNKNMLKEKMINEIGSPTTMSERPDIKDKWPADIIPELPQDLEKEMYALVQWLQNSIGSITSRTGPNSQARNLPWVQNGLQGFLRKLWYGKHPDNPSYNVQADWTSPLVCRNITLKEYQELESILDKRIGESLICEYTSPALEKIMDQFWGKLKQIVLQHVISNKIVRPWQSSPIKKHDSDIDVEPITQTSQTTPLPPLEPTNAKEKQESDEILSQKDAWGVLNRKIIDELPELKNLLKNIPNNFSEFRDKIDSAIQSGEYKPVPLISMCLKKKELQQRIYQTLITNWHVIKEDEDEDDESFLKKIPKELLKILDEEEISIFKRLQGMSAENFSAWTVREISDAGKMIINFVGKDPDTILEKLIHMVAEDDEKTKYLPPTVRLIIKQMQVEIENKYGGKVPQDIQKRFAQAVLKDIH